MTTKTKIQQKKTILLYCQGDDEFECAKHIRTLCGRKGDKEITIKNGHDSSLSEILRKAINNREGYDEVCIWVDCDSNELDLVKDLAEKCNIKIVINMPDLEICMLNFHEILIKPDLPSKQQYDISFPCKQLNNQKTYISLFSDIEKIKNSKYPFANICELMS